MNIKKILSASAFVCIVSATANMAFALDKIDADDFVDEVSAKGIAEVESAKLALQKSTSADVKTFAQAMINDHSAANKELASIASRKKLDVSTEAELTTKAKKFVLEQREGESFNEAYANNQVKAHEETIKLFQQAAVSDDPDIAEFAKATLPTLAQHLKMAKDLAAAHHDKE